MVSHGYLISQNMHNSATEHTHSQRDAALHFIYPQVCYATSYQWIINPIFFFFFCNNVNGKTIIIVFWTFACQLHDDELQFGFLQQNFTRSHITHETINGVQQFFDNGPICIYRYLRKSWNSNELLFIFRHDKLELLLDPVHTIDLAYRQVIIF